MDRAGLLQKLARSGEFDARVLRAIGSVDRTLFLPPERASQAWEDCALPIGYGQTVSQPLIVAMMSQALSLEGWERVLEVGTGAGYQTAVLSQLCGEVASVELIPELAASARERLEQLGVENVQLRCGDGWQGWPELAPFDAMIVTAAPATIPVPLLEQLGQAGRLVIPVGPESGDQRLQRICRVGSSDRFETRDLGAVRFVPLVDPLAADRYDQRR